MSASTATAATNPVADGNTHALTHSVLDGMVALLASMAAGREVNAFTYDHRSHPGHPAFGYRLAAGTFNPSTYLGKEIFIVAEDHRVVAMDPQDSVYFVSLRANEGWTYEIVPGHSVVFVNAAEGTEITYVFVPAAS